MSFPRIWSHLEHSRYIYVTYYFMLQLILLINSWILTDVSRTNKMYIRYTIFNTIADDEMRFGSKLRFVVATLFT